jgi:type IV secretory pathway ATPase VirB11/archaellum biosynthesis ATPase
VTLSKTLILKFKKMIREVGSQSICLTPLMMIQMNFQTRTVNTKTMNMIKVIDKLIFNNVYCSYFIILTNRAVATRAMLSSKKFNLIILGDGAVGKTSLLKMYHSG